MLRKDLTPSDLRKLVAAGVDDLVRTNRFFVDGDHWQNGAGWVGPKPPQDDEGSQEVMAQIKTAFTSANRILEVCQRHAGGVAGREPQWGFTIRAPLAQDEEISDADKSRIDEIEAALTAWWNERGVHEKFIEAVVALAWGRRSVLRLYIPSGLREQPPEDKQDLLAWLLKMVYVDVVQPENGCVYEDPGTKQPIGIVTYKDEQQKDITEVSYLDESGENTLIDVINDAGAQTSDPLQLGGRITMFELSRRPLVSTQMQQQQRSHNLALSILPRNLVTAGFLERTMLNAAMPGKWDNTDPDNPVFKPAKIKMGAGSTTWLEGIEITDEVNGKKALAQPGIVYRDPVPVAPTIEAATASYQAILEEAQQAHILMTGDAVASGKSRVEARKDYESSLRVTKPVVERAARWLLETALALADALASSGDGTADLLTYRADVNVRLDLGVVTPQERDQNIKSVNAGILPREVAIAGEGIDDVDAAIALINAQSSVVLNDLQKKATIVQLLTQAGTDMLSAATIAGFSPEEAALLAKGTVFEGDPNAQA